VDKGEPCKDVIRAGGLAPRIREDAGVARRLAAILGEPQLGEDDLVPLHALARAGIADELARKCLLDRPQAERAQITFEVGPELWFTVPGRDIEPPPQAEEGRFGFEPSSDLFPRLTEKTLE
jgi:hypothetical protein